MSDLTLAQTSLMYREITGAISSVHSLLWLLRKNKPYPVTCSKQTILLSVGILTLYLVFSVLGSMACTTIKE